MLTRRHVLGLLASSPLLARAATAAFPLGAMPDPVSDLALAFTAPPPATRPYVLWMWMGSNISREGITLDLEAMRDAGIGGATIFSLADTLTPWAGVIHNSPTPEVVTWTEPWWKLLRHAASECRRLGLELILHNCAGYESSGGSWITPELAMQEIIFAEKKMTGGKTVNFQIERKTVDPHPNAQFPINYIPSLGHDGIPEIEGRRTFYRDIATLAVKTVPPEGPPALDDVLDLSSAMDAAGNIATYLPPGEWTVYRFGHTTTGAMIQPAQWGALGLECDKMSKEAVTFHCRHVLDDIKAHVGDLIGNPGLSTFYFDSYEAGRPNWTPRMREEFRSRRGYDLLLWLPTFAGRTLNSSDETAAFKEDFKQTVSDLYRDNYWGTPRALAHEYGLAFVAEPYEGPWKTPEAVPLLDHANMEFWTHHGKYYPVYANGVNDTAHAVGQRIVGAEAFTTAPEWANWQATPAWLKPIGDAAFCDGVNRVNIHHFVQQPWSAAHQPGNAMGQWGIHLGRYQTWWEPGKAWFTYLWRCQTLLQTGDFVPASTATSAQFDPAHIADGLELKSIHRIRGREHIYFLANLAPAAGSARATFPVTGLQPELWDPVTGLMQDLTPVAVATTTTTTLDLGFAPSQSWFVVFRKPLQPARPPAPALTRTNLADLSRDWLVHFDPAWGGPASVAFPTLTDWSRHANPGIRFYSGTAAYKRTFRLTAAEARQKLWLELGEVKNLATVTLNGKKLGVVWTAPWRVDLTPALRPGENHLEVAVTNTWANRLIGDENQPADITWQAGDPVLKGGYFLKELPSWFLENKPRPTPTRYTFTTWNYFKPDSPLLPAGLLGPVHLVAEHSAESKYPA